MKRTDMLRGRLPAIIACCVSVMPALAAKPGLAQAPLNPGIELVNHAGAPITELYVKATGSPKWGTNELGGPPVPAGETRSVKVISETTCLFDIRAIYADGRTEEQDKVNVCARQPVIFEGKQASAGKPQ